MPQVQVNIGGRPYRLACSPGEEPHLASLAELVDARTAEMRGAFRDIDDQRLVVMAALSIADDLVGAQRKGETRERAAAEAMASEQAARQTAEARIAALETAVAEAISRLEALTESFSAAEED